MQQTKKFEDIHKKKINIWVNHWFSTMYNLIEGAKRLFAEIENADVDLYFIGTNKKEDCVYKLACDYFTTEPTDLSGDDYVDWCLDFCKLKKVDIFIPRREMMSIAQRKGEFEEIGVTVVCDDFYKVALFEDKCDTYMSCLNHADSLKGFEIPAFGTVTNYKGYSEVLETLQSTYPDDRICFKYSAGEGATSFRVLDDRVETIESLSVGKGMKISYSDADRMFKEAGSFDKLMLLPYMEGPEISIDCFTYKDTFYAIPRRKEGRVTHIVPLQKYIDIAKEFNRVYNLKYPFNLQLRKFKGMYNLLEVNTRMSGGSHKVEFIADSNVAILGIVIADILGVQIPEGTQAFMNRAFNMGYLDESACDSKITQIETPLVLY